jgi:hypothetical protein
MDEIYEIKDVVLILLFCCSPQPPHPVVLVHLFSLLHLRTALVESSTSCLLCVQAFLPAPLH